MSDIHIERGHALGIERAREVTRQWIEHAKREYGMACRYTEGATAAEGDMVQFARPGVEGRVRVTADSLALHLTLGFLLAAFGPMIEDKAARKIDRMLADAAGGGSAPAA